MAEAGRPIQEGSESSSGSSGGSFTGPEKRHPKRPSALMLTYNENGQPQQAGSSRAAVLQQQFNSFATFGSRTSNKISMLNLEKWFRQACVIGRRDAPEVAITFKKLFRPAMPIDLDQTRAIIREISEKKSIDYEYTEYLLKNCGRPAFNSPRLARRTKGRD